MMKTKIKRIWRIIMKIMIRNILLMNMIKLLMYQIIVKRFSSYRVVTITFSRINKKAQKSHNQFKLMVISYIY
jgi:hypothetical protein